MTEDVVFGVYLRIQDTTQVTAAEAVDNSAIHVK